jgi:hypothetical protein
VSAQSIIVSQSSSTPLLQDSSRLGGGPQSSAQLQRFSMPVQVRSPQQLGPPAWVEQLKPSSLQRGSLQPTGFWPP